MTRARQRQSFYGYNSQKHSSLITISVSICHTDCLCGVQLHPSLRHDLFHLFVSCVLTEVRVKVMELATALAGKRLFVHLMDETVSFERVRAAAWFCAA